MIQLRQIYEAQERIRHIVKTTPILSSDTISAETGNYIFFKCEHLQKTGAFKIRGASNKVIVEAQDNIKHVVAASSGNHGQAVAYIAGRLGIPATIVVPEDAAACKRDAIRAYKGRIENCGTTSEERIERAKQISGGGQSLFIPPYDDPFIMAGQGTAGLEIIKQLDEIDEVYIPVGGGGLISGVATAIKESQPGIRIIGVEPAMANDTYLSFQQGKRVNIGGSQTIADGLRTSIPGELTFSVVQKYVDDIVLVEEEDIKSAIRIVLTRMKQLIEPSGAVSVAGALKRKPEGKRIVAFISGGNVDVERIPDLLE
ncbi:threonine/serine dehydratase [Siminovitchia sediminis]|uniref:Threonine/serine dehydratase n=1 Tax=Siminovitchia sediminis TaxID=1274353 RepID=A0ABW4KHU2_9BACI